MSCSQILKEKGYRFTTQRAAVLQILHETDEHITAGEIYQDVKTKYPKLNKSTIYRTLELMKQLGLVTETDFGGDRFCYHLGEKGLHHHLICRKCGRIIDLDESAIESLNKFLVNSYNFVPEIRHLAIFGRCLSCQSKDN
jgi:Fur family ferric uptake transcriptional regulator